MFRKSVGPQHRKRGLAKLYVMKGGSVNPWEWVPTLYFAEGIPYVIINTVSVIMFKRMGMSNGDVAMFTSMLYLPWVIKPLWSPFVDIIRTKRWWTVTMQVLMAVAFAAAALVLPSAEVLSGGAAPVSAFWLTLVIFWITAFASATHDIAADGFYMLALNQKQQSFFVGIRSTFYRFATIFGQGVLVYIAGKLEVRYGDIPLAWKLTLVITALIFGILALQHLFLLPRPASDRPHLEDGGAHSRPAVGSGADSGAISAAGSQAMAILKEFARTFVTFFRKKGIWTALAFMLLYRLPEAFIVKMLNPFLLDPPQAGGLGLSTEAVGLVYGTVGVAALTIGGIIGGIAVARYGLKKMIWPMALSLMLTCSVFVYLSIVQPSSLWTISACVVLDQFGYGFGFTAYMLYLIMFSEGEFKTAHYSICTAFMALSMMLPGMIAGYLQERLGYELFFWMVMLCCLATVIVTLSVKIEGDFGKTDKK